MKMMMTVSIKWHATNNNAQIIVSIFHSLLFCYLILCYKGILVALEKTWLAKLIRREFFKAYKSPTSWPVFVGAASGFTWLTYAI